MTALRGMGQKPGPTWDRDQALLHESWLITRFPWAQVLWGEQAETEQVVDRDLDPTDPLPSPARCPEDPRPPRESLEAPPNALGQCPRGQDTAVQQPEDAEVPLGTLSSLPGLTMSGRTPALRPASRLPQPSAPHPTCVSHVGWGYSRLKAVGSGQHPLGVDEGPPTLMQPPAAPHVVEPQADLPRVASGGDITASHNAHLMSWARGWGGKLGGHEGPRQ